MMMTAIRGKTGTTQGQAWAKRQWNPDSCTTKPTDTWEAKACDCTTKRSKLKTVQPVAMACAANKMCLKGLTKVLHYKWSKLEQNMMAKGHSSVKKYGDEPFPSFILIRRPIKEPKVRSEHMKSFNYVVALECAEPDVNRLRTVIKQGDDGGGLQRMLGPHLKLLHLNFYGPRKDDMEANIQRIEHLKVNRACHLFHDGVVLAGLSQPFKKCPAKMNGGNY